MFGLETIKAMNDRAVKVKKDCPECDGVGEVFIHHNPDWLSDDDEDIMDMGEDEAVQCPICKGYGEVEL